MLKVAASADVDQPAPACNQISPPPLSGAAVSAAPFCFVPCSFSPLAQMLRSIVDQEQTDVVLGLAGGLERRTDHLYEPEHIDQDE